MATFRKRSGKWQVRVQRRGQRDQSQTFANRVDAEKWARSVEREMDVGKFESRREAPAQPFRDLLRRYRIEVSPSKRGGDQEVIRLTALEHRPIADVLANEVTPTVVAEYRDRRLQEVSAVTVNRDLDDLSAVLNHARREWGMDVGQKWLRLFEQLSPIYK